MPPAPVVTSGRIGAQHRDFLKEAKEKFPEWNNHAAAHLKTLKTQNINKSLKGYDLYLLKFLGDMQDAARAEAEGSADKSKSPKKKSESAKESDPKPSPAKRSKNGDAEADPLLVEILDRGVSARAAADDEDSQAKDAPEKHAEEIDTPENALSLRQEAPAGIRDGDVLLDAGGGVDEVSMNLAAVEEAEKRELRARKEKPKEPTPPPQRKKAIATSKPVVDTESDDEDIKPAKKTKTPQRKRKKSEGTIAVDSKSEDEKDKKGRFKPKEVSRILAEYDIASIRPLSQQMMLSRDGIDVNTTAPARLLNMHTILQAAEQKMEGRVFKSFKTALFNSYDDKSDQ